jgi:hypothetical protein
MLIRSLVTVMSHEEPVSSAGRNGWNAHELVGQLDKPERQQCAEFCLLEGLSERLLLAGSGSNSNYFERQLTGKLTFRFHRSRAANDPEPPLTAALTC